MARSSNDVTDAELAILECLWSNGPQSMKQIAESLYGSASASNNSTVQKLLSRMEHKDCAARDREQWPHLFAAAIDKDELIARRLQSTADQCCDGSLTPLLTHLVSHGKMTAAERSKLQQLLKNIK